MNEKRFLKNLLMFFGVVIVWTVLDVLSGKEVTDKTQLFVISSFLVWNYRNSKDKTT